MHHTSTQAPDATASRHPADARALLAVLLAPLIALFDQSMARLFGRLDALMAQFRAGTLPAPVQATPAPAQAPRPAALAPRPAADKSWLTRLLELASPDDASTAPDRAPQFPGQHPAPPQAAPGTPATPAPPSNPARSTAPARQPTLRRDFPRPPSRAKTARERALTPAKISNSARLYPAAARRIRYVFAINPTHPHFPSNTRLPIVIR